MVAIYSIFPVLFNPYIIRFGIAATAATPSIFAPSLGSTPPNSKATPLCTAPPLYLGLDAYRHWDKLSYLELGDRVWGQSTADLAGSNNDYTHTLQDLIGGEHVLFDQTGPGLMTFMRMQESYGTPWNLYLDGQYRLTVSADSLGQPQAPFPYPLSLNITQTQGSSIVATSLPFNQSMRWTSTKPNGNFYSLYHKLAYGTPLTTWTGNEPTADVVQLLNQAGTDIAPTAATNSNISSQSGTINLFPGMTTPIATLTGPSQLRAIQFRVPFDQKVPFGNTHLQIYWDDETTPSVDAPLKFMVGVGAGVYQPPNRNLVQAWPVNTNSDGSTFMDFNLYWPMPFHTSARIVLYSEANSPAISGINWDLRYESFLDPTNWWGTFHANYTSIPNPTFGQDMTFLDVTGSGRIVGTVVNFNAVGLTLEGDPHFFLDDNHTPQIQVTGTEEWGTGGNYWNGGNQTSLALGGLPSSTNNPTGTDVDGAALYRFLIADSIPFNRHAILRWEHGGVNQSNEPYRASVFWYGSPTQTALLSDELLVGDASSRLSHNYQSPSGHSYQLSSASDYSVYSPLITATGITMNTTSSFTLAINPQNVGAFLRRKFDYASPNQRANIFVDGQFAGTWYSSGSFKGKDTNGQLRRWREEEFPLPPALTAGKALVHITVEYVPTANPFNQEWTEFSYQLYSFVSPDCSYSYYLPHISNGANGYTSYLAFQNRGGGQANISLQYYTPSGQLVTSDTTSCTTLAVNAECRPPNPFSVGSQGTGVLTSSQPLAVIVPEATPYGGSAYTVSSGGASQLIVPLAFRNAYKDFSTQLFIFNASPSATELQVEFYDSSGNLQVAATQSFNMGAWSGQSLDQSLASSKLPIGFTGWARITGVSDSQLVAQVLEQSPSRKFVAIAAAQPTSQATQLYAPAIFKGAFGFNTGTSIINPTSQALTVTVTYYDVSGNSITSAPFRLFPNSAQTIYQGDSSGLPAGFAGAAIITATTGGVVMLVNEGGNVSSTGAMLAGSYAAVAIGSTSVSLPVMANGGFGYTTGTTIFNTSNQAVNGTIQYSNLDGTTQGSPQPFNIGPYASQLIYQGTFGLLPPNFYGTAMITQTGGGGCCGLVVTTNALADLFYTYTEPNN
jgi:hypothetical protein